MEHRGGDASQRVLKFAESSGSGFEDRRVVLALAAGIVARLTEIRSFRFEKHTGVNAFGVTALARHDVIALHGRGFPS